ncbi:O-antigen ligase family protein [Rhodoblastus sp.]|uniref:O-antigen ligase family protein n=1 Tax=Rhodoblastus sp. TaxID=1962975 RepID=UPI0035AFA493
MSLAGNSLSISTAPRAARTDWIARAHDALLIGYLLFTFIGTHPLAAATATPEERLAGSPLDRLLLPMMTVIGLGLIWARREAAWETARANRLLLAVVLFCQASLIWSNYPDLTLRRAMLLLFVTAISLGLAATIKDMRAFHARVFQALVFVILVNLAATAAFPAIAVTDIGVAGIYGQKNPAGMVAMIAMIVCVTYAFGARGAGEAMVGALGAAISFFFLVITRSKTSLGLTLLALAIGFLFWLTQRLGFRFALLALAGIALLLAGLTGLVVASDFDFQKVLGAFVADTSFTGRDELWGFAWRSALQNPWFGHGYGAFWDVGAVNDPLAKLEPGTWLGDVQIGIINQAHNGYLELFLHIGIPMTIAAVCAVFVALGRATGLAITTRGGAGGQAAYGMIALTLMLYLLHNLTEATLMMRGAPFANLALLLCFASGRRFGADRMSRHAR